MKPLIYVSRVCGVLLSSTLALSFLIGQPTYAQTPKPPRNITNSKVTSSTASPRPIAQMDTRFRGNPNAIQTTWPYAEARLREITYIDCGKDDARQGLYGNSEDIGRVHADRSYIQATDKAASQFAGEYFGYGFDLASPRSVVMRLYDADNVSRFFNVVINGTYVYAIDHYRETSQTSVGGWKEYFITIPAEQLREGHNRLEFEYRSAFPPAIADIWIYQIGE